MQMLQFVTSNRLTKWYARNFGRPLMTGRHLQSTLKSQQVARNQIKQTYNRCQLWVIIQYSRSIINAYFSLSHNFEFHLLNSWWNLQFIWEEKVHIYGTSRVYNNFLSTTASILQCKQALQTPWMCGHNDSKGYKDEEAYKRARPKEESYTPIFLAIFYPLYSLQITSLTWSLNDLWLVPHQCLESLS